MIKNIIFDIGDVLVKSDWKNFFKNKGFDVQTAERLAKASFFSPVWKELDRGTLSFDEIVDGFVKNDPDAEKQLRTAFSDLRGFIKEFPYSHDWIFWLKEKGLEVYCLSNISDRICTDCADELDFLPLVDGMVLSYEERLIKPDKAIFDRLLTKYGLTAAECIFVDDLEENVNAARSLGIHGIVFKSKEQAQNEIDMIRSAENE